MEEVNAFVNAFKAVSETSLETDQALFTLCEAISKQVNLLTRTVALQQEQIESLREVFYTHLTNNSRPN